MNATELDEFYCFVAAFAYLEMCVLSYGADNRAGGGRRFLEVPQFEQQIGISSNLS